MARVRLVLADPAALEQVLANLLDNAVKYSDAARDHVRVRSSRAHATVEITDRGIGIAPGDTDRIFERFYRAAGTRRRPGFGLGLPIVRELMHRARRPRRSHQRPRQGQHVPGHAAARTCRSPRPKTGSPAAKPERSPS